MLALLPTKLAIPPLRPEVVARPRLLDRLTAVERVPLTVVTAPAGFGKTTLLAAWAASWPHPVAWVALDEGDDARGPPLKGSGSPRCDYVRLPSGPSPPSMRSKTSS